MARTTGSDGEKTEAAVREAAVGLIARLGYEAMSMRQLGAQVGVQAAALYRYFPTKEDLLFTLMREHMEGLLEAWNTARPAAADPAARLTAYVENHIAFHIERRHATHVSNMELRSLSHERLTQILKLRTAYEKELRAILAHRHGADPDDDRRHRLVPAGRTAVDRRSHHDISFNDNAARRREDRHLQRRASVRTGKGRHGTLISRMILCKTEVDFRGHAQGGTACIRIR